MAGMNTIQHTSAVVIGGGQAGLAVSHFLTTAGVDHVVLERGRVAERWRSERWDSLRLLTPNWQSRLPGWCYRGDNPEGYMSMPEIVDHLAGYARSFGAPVVDSTTVERLELGPSGYRVVTDRGTWHAPAVVIATGATDTPVRPAAARRLHPSITQIAPTQYRNPHRLPDGGVLVVGAAASGVQLAGELAAAGRDVTLAVGDHRRMPRLYRGVDVQRWLDVLGLWSEDITSAGEAQRARRASSLQLIGTPERRSIDLGTLRADGVMLAGRVVAAEGASVDFDRSLPITIARSDHRMYRLLDRIDRYVDESGIEELVGAPDRPQPLGDVDGLDRLDLRAARISTVIWATGFRRSYPWLHIPVLDASGEIRHHRGATPAPGLFVIGLPGMIRRNSTFIDGVGADAREITAALNAYLGHAIHPADIRPNAIDANTTNEGIRP